MTPCCSPDDPCPACYAEEMIRVEQRIAWESEEAMQARREEG